VAGLEIDALPLYDQRTVEDLRHYARITSQSLPWRTHSCVPRRVSLDAGAPRGQRAPAPVPTLHAGVRAPHLPVSQCEVIPAWALS
jgi:hypothetical protein